MENNIDKIMEEVIREGVQKIKKEIEKKYENEIKILKEELEKEHQEEIRLLKYELERMKVELKDRKKYERKIAVVVCDKKEEKVNTEINNGVKDKEEKSGFLKEYTKQRWR